MASSGMDASAATDNKIQYECHKGRKFESFVCIKCGKPFHNSCANRDWLKKVKIIDQTRLICLDHDITSPSEVYESEISILLRELVTELKEKNSILQENKKLLEEKVTRLELENATQKTLQKSKVKSIPNASVAWENCDLSKSESRNINSPSYAEIANNENPQQQQTAVPRVNPIFINNNGKVGNVIRPVSCDGANSDTHRQNISSATVRGAILQAQTASKFHEMHNLAPEAEPFLNGRASNANWETQRPKRRRKFLVGGNTESSVSTVPRYVQLHVTRLNPNMNLDELRSNLVQKFPNVQLEDHTSKRPDIYKSCKVTIQRQQLKDAWNRDVWPSGAVVSHFFQKKRMVPLSQADPAV